MTLRAVAVKARASSLLRFALNIPKNRLQGDFLSCKLQKQAG
jgi:hypothetical protein